MKMNEIEVIRRDEEGNHLEAFWLKVGNRPLNIGETLEIIQVIKTKD